MLGCVRSHEIPKKTHPLLLSQACQAKRGMTKCVRDGSITVFDYDAQSLEVVRSVGTCLFMNRIDHLRCNDNVRNNLLDDLIIDFDDERGIVCTARYSDQTNSLDCFTHGQCSRLRGSEKCEICGRNTCAGNCSERSAANSHSEFFQAHWEQVQAECSRCVPVPDQNMRKGQHNQSRTILMRKTNVPQTSKRQATSAAATPAKTSKSCGTLDELAERLGSFHESVRVLANCLQKRDASHQTDQYDRSDKVHVDDLDQVTCPPGNRAKNLCIKCQQKRHRRNLQPEDDPREQLELSAPQRNPGVWKYDFKMSTFTTTILNSTQRRTLAHAPK